MANPELGAKQICPSCQSKFYDLGKRPATCPKCGHAFDPEEAVRNRRIRARSTVPPDYEADEEKEVKPKDDEVEGFEEEADETPEIDQAIEADVVDADEDEGEAAAPAAPADALGVDFAEDEELAEADEDVPFLEDEEEDDFPEDEIEGLPGEGDDDR